MLAKRTEGGLVEEWTSLKSSHLEADLCHKADIMSITVSDQRL